MKRKRTRSTISKGAEPSPARSRAAKRALRREPHSAATHEALSSQARASARERGPADLKRAGRKAARTRKSRS
jgi:hypothetical protein